MVTSTSAGHYMLQNRPHLDMGGQGYVHCEALARQAVTFCFEFESREVVCISAMHRLVRLHLETNCKKLGTNKICLGPSISGLVLLPREALARPLRRVQRT